MKVQYSKSIISSSSGSIIVVIYYTKLANIKTSYKIHTIRITHKSFNIGKALKAVVAIVLKELGRVHFATVSYFLRNK